MSEELGLTVKKNEDFSKWYLEIIQKAEIMDIRYGVKGFPVYMPTAMTVIKQIEGLFERELEKTGHNPVSFPVVIPEKYMTKEEKHIKGFCNEVFWITHAGKKKLKERVCLRPTSETAMYPLYSLWIRSHVHLPLKLYQTVSVYRYETKMTKPLIRGREFRWIEAHTAQKTYKDAQKQVEEDMTIFENVTVDKLALPFILVKRPEWDRFAGAADSYAYDCILPDGKILQIGTTHNLGDNFAKTFNIKYTDSKGNKKYVNQTSFGPGIARILGALISVHGDDKGMILPPGVAPIQIVIIPIYTTKTEKFKTKILEKAAEIYGKLSGKYRVHLDDRENFTPGFKFHDWELKGVPLRIEIGPKDIENKNIVIVRRDMLEKIVINEEDVETKVVEAFSDTFYELQKRAKTLLTIEDVKDYSDLKKKLKNGGIYRIEFCGKEKCAKKLKEETTAEVRGTLFGKEEKVKKKKCDICEKKASIISYVGKAY